MSLRLRLTLLIFAITVPVLMAVGLLVATVAGNNLEQDANAQLARGKRHRTVTVRIHDAQGDQEDKTNIDDRRTSINNRSK